MSVMPDSTSAPPQNAVACAVAARFGHLPAGNPIVSALTALAVARGVALLGTKPTRRGATKTTLLPTVPTPEELIATDPVLTSLPEVFMRIREVLSDPSSTVEEAASIIGKDPSLTAKLLKLVNSPFYTRTLCVSGGMPPGPVDTLSRAVMLLGLNQLSTLAMGVSVLPLFKDIPPQYVDMGQFWRHAVGVGLVAKLLAARHHDPNPERFFVAGLLHDIGRLVLYKHSPAAATTLLARADAEGCSLLAVEREALGFDHAVLGGILLDKWHFPSALKQAVRHHHDPMTAEIPLEPSIINVADMLACALLPGSSGGFRVPDLVPEAWDAVGLEPEDLSELAQTAEAHLDIICAMFN